MAEYIMKELVKREGVAGDWEIESAAVSREEIGNPVYPLARRKLLEQGIPCGQHAARQMTRADYDRFDLLIGMDRSNLRTMQRICGGDPEGKIFRLLDFTGQAGNVADPWYTDDFEATYRDIKAGCEGLLLRISEKE